MPSPQQLSCHRSRLCCANLDQRRVSHKIRLGVQNPCGLAGDHFERAPGSLKKCPTSFSSRKILNVPQRVRLRCFLACGLADHLFEQPHHTIDAHYGMPKGQKNGTGYFSVAAPVWRTVLLPCLVFHGDTWPDTPIILKTAVHVSDGSSF